MASCGPIEEINYLYYYVNQCVKSAHLWTIIFYETIDSWIILLLRFPVIVPYFHNFNQELELAMHALGQKMRALAGIKFGF